MMRETARKSETATIENPLGIFRTTIAYNDQLMLCHFFLKKGVRIPFHGHVAVQNGYLISGKLRMLWESGQEFIAEPGSGWCFDSNVRHGAEALEDSEAIECFAPTRPQYISG
jgi:quercetin dioxygenase-like cupin family protein